MTRDQILLEIEKKLDEFIKMKPSKKQLEDFMKLMEIKEENNIINIKVLDSKWSFYNRPFIHPLRNKTK